MGAFESYLAAKHGTGIGGFATEAGTHSVSERVANEYSVAGQQIPEDVAIALQELNTLAQGEKGIAGSTAGERRMLQATGQWNPQQITGRHQELMQLVTERTRDVANAKKRIEFTKAEIGLKAAEENLETQRLLRPMQLETSQLALERARIQTTGQKLTAERRQETDDLLSSLQNVTTSDMVAAARTRNPQTIQSVFGEGVSPDLAMRALSQRLDNESGAADAFSEADAEAALSQREQLIAEHGTEGLQKMLGGEIPPAANMDVLTAALETSMERDVHASGVLSLMADTQSMQAAVANEQTRKDLLKSQLRSFDFASLGALGEQVNIDVAGKFQLEGMPGVEFSTAEINSELALIEEEILAAEQQRQTMDTAMLVRDSMLDQSQRLLDNTANTLGFIPPHIQNQVDLGSAQMRQLAAQGDVEGMRKLSRELVDGIIESLSEAKIPEDQAMAIATDRLADDKSYHKGLTDFFTSPTAANRMAPFGKSVAQQLQALGGKSITPETASELAAALGDPELGLTGALKTIGISPAHFESVIKGTYTALATTQVGEIMSQQGFLGEDVPVEVAEDMNRMLADAMIENEALGKPLDLNSVMDAVQTVSHAHGLGNLLFEKFQEAYAQTDLSGLFQSPGGSGMAEAGMVNLIAQMYGSSDGSGPNSIPISASGEVLEDMLRRQVENEMVGRANLVGTRGPIGQRQVDYLLGSVFADAPGVRQMSNLTADVEDVRRQFPEVAAEITRFVARHQITRSNEEVSFWQKLTGGFGMAGSDSYGPTAEEVREHLREKGLME